MNRVYIIFISIISILTFHACTLDENIGLQFTEVTKEAGIDFLYNFGDYTYKNILESSGSGVTVFDYDGDGDMDLYMLNGTYLKGISDQEGEVFLNTPNQLYRNNGNGTFSEIANHLSHAR